MQCPYSARTERKKVNLFSGFAFEGTAVVDVLIRTISIHTLTRFITTLGIITWIIMIRSQSESKRRASDLIRSDPMRCTLCTCVHRRIHYIPQRGLLLYRQSNRDKVDIYYKIFNEDVMCCDVLASITADTISLSLSSKKRPYFIDVRENFFGSLSSIYRGKCAAVKVLT